MQLSLKVNLIHIIYKLQSPKVQMFDCTFLQQNTFMRNVKKSWFLLQCSRMPSTVTLKSQFPLQTSGHGGKSQIDIGNRTLQVPGSAFVSIILQIVTTSQLSCLHM